MCTEACKLQRLIAVHVTTIASNGLSVVKNLVPTFSIAAISCVGIEIKRTEQFSTGETVYRDGQKMIQMKVKKVRKIGSKVMGYYCEYVDPFSPKKKAKTDFVAASEVRRYPRKTSKKNELPAEVVNTEFVFEY